jgi:hypothetical protein
MVDAMSIGRRSMELRKDVKMYLRYCCSAEEMLTTPWRVRPPAS